MKFEELKNRFEQLKPFIEKAGEIVHELRKNDLIQVTIKEDGSPVTTADIRANTYLKRSLQFLYPGEPVIGEEDDDKTYPAGSPLVWYIDPIDGTRSYIDGQSQYYVLIGLVENGKPVMGLHYRPETGDLLYGWTGQYPEVENLKTKDVTKTTKPAAWKSNPRIFLKSNNPELKKQFADLGVERARFAPGMVDMVAPLFGLADGFVTFRRTAYWDLAAPAAIMAAAGFIGPHEKKNGSTSQFLFNDGAYKTDLYYSLPADSPTPFISKITDLSSTYGGN